jgi:predicted DsbA family dithiol-disulfide isomerase
MKAGRRLLLIGGTLAIIAVYKYQLLPAFFQKPLQFEPLETPAGFRRIPDGQSSIGFDPFVDVDVDARSDPEIELAIKRVRENICESLFGQRPIDDSVVQIALFSDFYCPYCRVLTQKLVRLEAESNGMILISWHELPIFGESSELAAKAAQAAKLQGAYTQFYTRLMKTPFQATPGYIKALADDIGVDYGQLRRDMEGDKVALTLLDSAALAEIFAFIGTPAMVIGRTVVQGAISREMLKQIIDQERSDGPLDDC